MIDKNSDSAKYVIEHLEKKHNKKEFSCGIETLDSYLKIKASQDVKKNVAATYVLTANNLEMVIGYYTLSSIGIFPGELPDELVAKLPRYPVLPGILIGRLAVDKNSQKKNIGTYLLIDALKRSLAVSKQIGIVAVLVEAINEKAAAFYKNHGFTSFEDNAHKLFLLSSTIRKLDL